MTPENIAAVFRAEYGRAVAVLVCVLGDIDLAEDAVADARSRPPCSAGRARARRPAPPTG